MGNSLRLSREDSSPVLNGLFQCVYVFSMLYLLEMGGIGELWLLKYEAWVTFSFLLVG